MFEYRCKVVRVIDGDTVVVDIDLGFGIEMRNQTIRLRGVDTPEVRTRDDIEKMYGNIAKDYVEHMLLSQEETHGYVVLKSYSFSGKYGRTLGDFIVEGSSLASMIIEEHVGVEYIITESKEDRAKKHVLNRTLISEEMTEGYI
tara:strand:- start:28266 stop:28697 length:432 start_codon:yes stop_codon:yes gene_type:complete